MKSHGRYSIATQSFCFQNREIPRPSPKLFEQILTKKGLGLRSRCVHGLNKLNPFATLQDWVPFSFIPAALHHLCIMCYVLQVGILNYVAQTMYVPSYMSWNDEFQAGACFIFSRSGQRLTPLFFSLPVREDGQGGGPPGEHERRHPQGPSELSPPRVPSLPECGAGRTQVDVFENELMDKVSKQQRSKMNRVQARPAAPRVPVQPVCRAFLRAMP